ncbi:hypothetical protein [Mucilaginibacter mallensis]|uniref:hypothetical protein n=1 Tax=Mucilaginibacter mallensis TaxID=652787 RepID=UPI0012F8C585|nr:hypothetical protein [Mucilaginibacter mallensis]
MIFIELVAQRLENLEAALIIFNKYRFSCCKTTSGTLAVAEEVGKGVYMPTKKPQAV